MTSDIAALPAPQFILKYWFGPQYTQEAPKPDSFKLWFMKSDETDTYIKENFVPLMEKLTTDEEYYNKYTSQDIWAKVATVILLDQFSRNAYRNTPQAFSNDQKSLQLAEEIIASDKFKSLPYWIRAFMFLPFEHSEKLEHQKYAVEKFRELSQEVKDDSEGAHKMCSAFADYAVKHMEVIEKHGRFPHRNAILGRENTKEEEEYLAQPGAGF